MAERILIRCAGYQGESSVHTRALRRFAELCGRLSGGAIVAEVTADVTAEGRRAADLIAMVESGELDLCYLASSYLAGRSPSLRVLDLPFPVVDRAATYAGLDGATGGTLRRRLEAATGLGLLAFWDNGVRHISNALYPIRSPADCRGLRIRCLDSDQHRALFRSMGFEPVTVDVRDLVRVVLDGEVDAQENPLTNTYRFGLHRKHLHLTETGHLFGFALLMIARERFESWAPATRDVVMAAAHEATAAQRRWAGEEDALCRAELVRHGCAILAPGEFDLAAFREAVAPLRDAEIARLDPELRAAARIA